MSARTLINGSCCAWALVLGLAASAQQDPLFTSTNANLLVVDPAYAGSADLLTTAILSRHQWSGLQGAPATQTITVHSPLPIASLGAGFSALHDKAGPVRSTALNLDIAYRARLSTKARLSFGIKVGVDMLSVGLGELAGVDATDPLFQQDFAAKARLNLGAGLFYWNDHAYLGASVPRILERERLATGAGDALLETYGQQRHYCIMGGLLTGLGKDLKLRPSFLLRAVEGAPISADLSAAFILKDRLWLGPVYRTSNALGAMVAYQVTEALRFGYTYDASMGALRQLPGGSHEWTVRYDLVKGGEKSAAAKYF